MKHDPRRPHATRRPAQAPFHWSLVATTEPLDGFRPAIDGSQQCDCGGITPLPRPLPRQRRKPR